MSSTEIKIDYDSLRRFAGGIKTSGADLGTPLAFNLYDHVSTIPANAAAHAALTDEGRMRRSMEKMALKDFSNLTVIGKGFITTEKKLKDFYDATFDFEIVGKTIEG